uniref:Uncharacterized protein n=1 Tax=Mandrillus leucophaeus TaxID=9568 RepID=A0A2K5Y785_MANLE
MHKLLVLNWIEKRQFTLFFISRRFKIDIMLLFNKGHVQTSPVTSILFLTAKLFLQSRITCYI